jgi:hypothetical protein
MKVFEYECPDHGRFVAKVRHQQIPCIERGCGWSARRKYDNVQINRVMP